ncbi:MAG: CheR family methyltransferase [Actinomycetes bacterium]
MSAPTPGRADSERETLEISLLLEGVFQHYGYDFRQYARASLRRRLWRRVYAERLQTISGLQERVLHDRAAMERLLLDLSINVTSMFRDPGFFAAFRHHVVPALRTYPFLRIWNAGCSTGEETYSLAILLREVGLYDRTRIYATDINESVLVAAAEGIYPLAKMKEFTENYLAAGGSRSFSDYYRAAYDRAQLDRSLTENVVFAAHNLVSDRSFNEFHVIVCRNVMIYFDRSLQETVHQLFLDSLVPFGVLALGRKETMTHSSHASRFDVVDEVERIYRKRVS